VCITFGPSQAFHGNCWCNAMDSRPAAEVPVLCCNHTCRCSGKDVSLHIRSGVRVFRGGIAPGRPNFCNMAYNICGCSVWDLLFHPFGAENIKVTSKFIIIIIIIIII